MKIKFGCKWSQAWQLLVNAVNFKTDGYFLVIRVDNFDKDQVRTQLNKLRLNQDKKGELRELKGELEWTYKAKTLNQNNLIWALIEIIVSVLNGKKLKGTKLIKARNEYYENLIRETTDPMGITVPLENEWKMKHLFKHFMREGESNGRARYRVWDGLSDMNTKEAGELIDHLFDTLSGLDIPVNDATSRDVAKYKEEWSDFKKGDK